MKKIKIFKREYNCKDVNSKMSSFIKKDLQGLELKRFMAHADVCEECKEELSIQFLISEGLKQLEKDDNYFNLQKRLEDRLTQCRREIVVRDRLVLFMTIVVVISLVAVIVMTGMVVHKHLF